MRTNFSINSVPNSLASKLVIRFMIRSDLPEVVAIEQQVFDFPWTEKEFIETLRSRNSIGMVVEHSQSRRVLGFCVYELAAKNTIEIMTLAVMMEWQRKGVGALIVEQLIAKLSPERRTRILACVREWNLGAHLFFARQGFTATGVLRDYYDDSDEDAYAFMYRLGEQPT
jgi:ribosomal-protein-alanine N-acetyltransferase